MELKVHNLIKGNAWDCSDIELPNEIIEEIKRTPIFRGCEDHPIWVPTNSRVLSSKAVYEEIRFRGQRGPWITLFWFRGHIPKFSFIAWLVAKGRIPTFDKLRAWNFQVSGNCLLCSNFDETRDHLFFGCCYSKHILEFGFKWTCTRPPTGDKLWPTIVDWFSVHTRGNSFRKCVLKIFWTCCIHKIWKERNQRLHQGEGQSCERILMQIKNEVALACAQFNNIKRTATNWDICHSWGIDTKVLSPA